MEILPGESLLTTRISKKIPDELLTEFLKVPIQFLEKTHEKVLMLLVKGDVMKSLEDFYDDVDE